MFFACSKALAMRVLSECDGGDQQRMDHLFRICTARLPSAQERHELLTSHRRLVEVLQRDPRSVAELVADNPGGGDPIELGAWTGVCSVVLNLHEFITRD